MPTNSVYDIRHLELDNVGRGKNRNMRAPPGGECHDIFGTRSPSSNGSSTPGSPGSSTPGSRRGSVVDTQHRLFGGPESSPRRVRDTLKSSIFADEVDNKPKASPKRQVGVGNGSPGINAILTASVLNGNGHLTPNGSNGLLTPVSCASPLCPSTPVRGTPNGSRRPSLDTKNRLFNVSDNDTSSNGSLSPIPSTPTHRVRQPPGGKPSGIF